MENNQFPEQQEQQPQTAAPAPQALVNEQPAQPQAGGTGELERQPNFGPQPPMGPQPLDGPAGFTPPVQPQAPVMPPPPVNSYQQPGAPVPPPAPGAYPPPMPGQPPMPGAYPPPAPKQSKGLAIASMVLGICSLVFCWSPFLALICSIIGLILGIIGKKKQQGGMALAGIITSSIGLAISVIIIIIAVVAVIGAFGALDYYW